MNKTYDLILFDLDDTLVNFSNSEKLSFFRILETMNLQNKFESIFPIYKRISKYLWHKLENNKISSEDLRDRRWLLLLDEIGKKNISAKTLSSMYLEFIIETTVLNDGMLDLLKDLKSKAKLSIITNGFHETQIRKLEKVKILNYFSYIFSSDKYGYSKPNPKLFQTALNKHQHTNKDSVLIVGDSISADIKGGKIFGIDTCWYNKKNDTNVSEIIPTYNINSVQEIYQFL